VEVHVTSQSFDSHIPWRKNPPVSKAGYGVVIADGRLITTEDLVRNAVLVEIRRPGDAVKTKATIRVADPRVNAALLEAPTRGLTPVEWSVPVKTGARIQLVQYNAAGQQQNGEGRITSIQVGSLPNLAQSILTFQVLTDLKLERVGAPAFHEGRLVGLVMQYDEGSQTSMVLPAAVLQRFVANASHPPYPGVAAAGLMWAPLIEPAKRQYLGLPDDNKGVMVLRTVPGSCTSGILQAGDVILAWDGQTIDSQGYYDDPDFGRLSQAGGCSSQLGCLQ
jgi:S1-C subfamily serine protease